METSLLSLLGTRCQFSHHGWAQVLTLARLYGWKPVRLPEHYLKNDGTWVGPFESRSIGAALMRALPDLPDHDFPATSPQSLNLVEYFAGARKQHLLDFVDICFDGDFCIT
ncbi:MAG: hypothetical protein HY329_13765 [Chloroflexi bacterium]|nr:hypothetical protein [Chloroflexota bacterium]